MCFETAVQIPKEVVGEGMSAHRQRLVALLCHLIALCSWHPGPLEPNMYSDEARYGIVRSPSWRLSWRTYRH